MIDIAFLKQNNLLLFEVISGSKAFGLATEKSDTDIRGVYYLPKKLFYGLEYIPQVANETNDEVYYELGRFIALLLKNNPNILEILATPEDCILYKHPIMDQLKSEDFISKLCKETFGGYALAQIKKARGLEKKIVNPIEQKRKSILDFCFILESAASVPSPLWLHRKNYRQENCGLVKMPNSKGMYALFYDTTDSKKFKGIFKKEDSNEVCLSHVSKEEELKAYLFFNQDAYSVYCKKYKEYWKWVEERNVERYETTQKHGKNYDAKNMMHTIRLLQSAIQIFKTASLNVRVENRDELLTIKAGNYSYDYLTHLADQLILELNELYHITNLQDKPNSHKMEDLLI